MKTTLAVLCCCALLPTFGLAQTKPEPRPVTLKLNIPAALGPDGTVQGAVELPFGLRNAIQAEFGYGAFRSLMLIDPEPYSQLKTTRARLEYRLYNDNYNPAWGGHYLAVEGFYKQIGAVNSMTVGRDCVYSQCGYFQTVQQPVTRYVVGGYLKAGQVSRFYQADGQYRFVLDVSARLGLRHDWVVENPVQLPFFGQYAGSDYVFRYYPKLFEINRFMPRSNRTFFVPDVQVSILLGYRLGRLGH